MTGALSLGWYIKISDMNGTFLDLSDVLKVQQENDNVQSSDARCDETIVAMRTKPENEVLETCSPDNPTMLIRSNSCSKGCPQNCPTLKRMVNRFH